jgi:UDP-glucose:tetrahydrobiopterin glucosyltransferase
MFSGAASIRLWRVQKPAMPAPRSAVGHSASRRAVLTGSSFPVPDAVQDARRTVKIALIAHLKYPIAEPFSGGLEMHTHMLARRLIARGHAVTLFAAEGSDSSLGLVSSGPPTGTPRTEEECAAVARAEHQAYAKILDHVAHGGFDLVHNNALHALPLLAADRLGPPMVTVLHTPPFPELENGVLARGRRDIRFVAVSSAVARMWRNAVETEETIPNGVELARFAPRLAAPKARYAIWSGRIVPEKGLHLAIAGAHRAGVELRIAGPATDPNYWNGTIAPMLGTGATYIGHLGHDVLAAEVAGACVAIVTPCFDEPFGLVVAEALACGTPVAGFARGALTDLLDEATGRLAAPDDVAGLARAIAAAAPLSRGACRARAEAIGDAAEMVRRYEALYLRLTSDTPALDEAIAA